MGSSSQSVALFKARTAEKLLIPHGMQFEKCPLRYPHQDSNLGLSLRRAALYPLSYGGFHLPIIITRPFPVREAFPRCHNFGMRAPSCYNVAALILCTGRHFWRTSSVSNPLTFQDMILRLHEFWSAQNCIIWQPYNIQVGAGTMNPATFLRVLGPEPWERRLR